MLLFLICGWLSELRNPLPGRERWGNGGGKGRKVVGGLVVVVLVVVGVLKYILYIG